MDEVPKLEWRISSVAALREPGRLRAVGEAIESDVDFRPTIAARTFPPRRRLRGSFADYMAGLAGRFDSAEAEGCFYERNVAPRGGGEVLLLDNGRLRHNRTHDLIGDFVDTDWFAGPNRIERLSTYLTRIADSVDAFYGYCSLNQMLMQRVHFLQKNAVTWLGRVFGVGRAMEDQAREVSDVYWWNYFGPAFVERWGRRLESIGVNHVITTTGAVVIWATHSPFVYNPKARSLGGYEWKRPFYEALGKDVFMWEGQQQREPGEVVPSWDDHHRAAGVDAASLPRPEPPIAKGRFLPRIVVLKNRRPLDEPADPSAKP
jgi:hypothetical protein